MSVTTYLLGVMLTGVTIGALAFGAIRARARWLPTWHGAPARLAEISGGLIVLITVPQLLGVVGLFRRWPVVVMLCAVGAIVGLVAGRPTRTTAAPSEPMGSIPGARLWTKIALLGAAGLVVLVFAQWTGHVAAVYAHGIRDGDSLWYHLPFAAHFVQSGTTTEPLFTDANPLVTYFPANVEIVNGVTMLFFRRDVLIPLANLGWLGLALLAGWCIGRRYGAAAVGLAAVATVMSIPVMATTQAGTARNDAAGVALFLVAVALVVNAGWNPVALGLAGAVNGIAFGVKLSVVPVALLLAAAVVIAAPRDRRRALVVPWLGGFVVFGSFWYIRNLVRVGNPLPWVEAQIGPISLPRVNTDSTSNTAVVDRITDGTLSRVITPGLDRVYGPLWSLVLVAIVAILVVAILRGRDTSARMLGVVAALGIAAYLVLPNTAPVRDSIFGADIFALNMRYAFPALVLTMVLVAALPRVDDPRVAAAAVGGFGFMTFAVWQRRGRFEASFEWALSTGQRVTGYGLVIALAAGVALCVWWFRSGRPGAVTVAVAVIALAAGLVFFYGVADDSVARRYQDPSAEATQPTLAWKWAQSIDHTRIGLAGALLQYPYVGRHLSNHVRWVGKTTDHGGFLPVNGCREWRAAVADGNYQYIVAALDLVGSNRDEIARIGTWTESIPGTSVVVRGDREVVYQLTQTPDPDACP